MEAAHRQGVGEETDRAKAGCGVHQLQLVSNPLTIPKIRTSDSVDLTFKNNMPNL